MIIRSITAAVVTGSTGCIGTALCKKLINEGITTYAVVRPGCVRLGGLPKGVILVESDISELRQLTNKIDKADAFFHLAWAHTIGPGRNDIQAQIDNIRYSVDAVEVAARLNCKVFIGAGSQAEYGRVEGIIKSDTPCFPENGYGIAKLCAGEMTRVECEKNNIDHLWLRVLSIFGPHDRPDTMITSTIRCLLYGQVPNLTKGEQLWDYLYSTDAANAFFCAAVSGINKKIYPVGSGESHRLREYVETLRNVINPNLVLNFGGREYANKQVMHLQADISEIHKDTGFLPMVSFKDGIKETINCIKNQVE